MALLLASGAQALHSVKRDPKASTGACLAPVKDEVEARRILRRNHVSVGKKTNSKQLISVAIGLQQLEILGGNEWIEGARVTFPKKRRYSRQTEDAIEMGANHRDGNVAHVVHELGHYAGHAGLYGPYKQQVGVCHVSNYCKVNYGKVNYAESTYRNEEFSEAFAAFVTHPELLKRSRDADCRDAYAFFASHFSNGHKYSVCDSKKLSVAKRKRELSR